MAEKIDFSNYEVTLIVSPETSELDLQKLVTRLQNQITQKDGQLFTTDNWGKQRLAYPIGKFEYGYYATLVFSYPTEKIGEVETDLRLSPEVVRYLLLSLDKEGITPADLKRVDPFKEQTPTPVAERTPARKPAARPARPTEPAAPLKDEATRMKELEEKLGTLLKED